MSLLSDLGTKVGAEFKSHRLRIEAVETNVSNLFNYTLPIASTDTLGGVKAGNNINIDSNGVISANSLTWGDLSTKPTTLAGYGITDGQTTLVSGTNIKTINGVTILGNGNIDTTQVNITGNSGTSTKLQTPRTIAGVLFDGTANIAIHYTNLVGLPVIHTNLSDFNNDLNYQTLSQVNTAIQAVVGVAPAALDTLSEIAAQLSNDESAVNALTSVVSNKADKDTTLSGYGILNAYTKSEVDAKILELSPTTDLSGIYTKSEINNLLIENTYTLPIASTTTLGGVKAGNNINIDSNGVISTNAITSVTWSEIISKPTTINEYGITDTYTKSEIDTKISTKVDIVVGKGLSTNDFTTIEKTKLAGIQPATMTNSTVVLNASQSIFNVNYTVGMVSVFMNGMKLQDGIDYTAVNGTSVVLTTPALNGDIIDITAYNAVLTQESYIKSEIDTKLSTKVDTVIGKQLSTEDYTNAEKIKLSGISPSANNYILPVASTTTLGGVKAGTNITIDTNGVISSSASAGASTWSSITSKPTTIVGYGITDAQPTLVSGANIKTINGASVLGSGDLVISGSSTIDPDKVVTKLYGATGNVDLSKHLMIKDDLVVIPSTLTPYEVVSASNLNTSNGWTELLAYTTTDFTLVCGSNTLNIKGIDSDVSSLSSMGETKLNLVKFRIYGQSYDTVFFVLGVGRFAYVIDTDLVVKFKIKSSDYGFSTPLAKSAVGFGDSMGNSFLAVGQQQKILIFRLGDMMNVDLSQISFSTEISNPDNMASGLFGYDMVYIRDKLFVSDSNYNSSKGKVYIFTAQWGSFSYTGSITLPASDVSTNNYFGSELFTDSTGLYLIVLSNKLIYRYRITSSLSIPDKSSIYYGASTLNRSYSWADVLTCDGKYIYIKMQVIINGVTTQSLLIYNLDLENVYVNNNTTLNNSIRNISTFGIIMYISGALTYNKFRFITPKLSDNVPKVLVSPNGSKFALFISDDGIISTKPYMALNYNTYSQSGTYYQIGWDWDSSLTTITSSGMTGITCNDATSLVNYKDFYISFYIHEIVLFTFETKITAADSTSITMVIPDDVVKYFDIFKTDIGFMDSMAMNSNLQQYFSSVRLFRKSTAQIQSVGNEGLWY